MVVWMFSPLWSQLGNKGVGFQPCRNKSCDSAADSLKTEDVIRHHRITVDWIYLLLSQEETLHMNTSLKSDLLLILWPFRAVFFFVCLFSCVFSEVIHDGRRTAQPVLCEEDCSPVLFFCFFSHSLVKSLGWCSDCGFVNLNFSVCSDSWVMCISVDYQY